MTSDSYSIDISDQQTYLTVHSSDIEKILHQALSDEQVAAADISVAIVDNETIWDLNQRYLCHDYPTDVLSFLLDVEFPNDENNAAENRPRGFGKKIDGELIVSAEMAIETAVKYGWTAHDELVLYIVHGLLHLCGYDDQSDGEREVMRSREREVLQRWNISPHESTMTDASGTPGISS
ncbi:MAG: rRNA maturation RNase YbeY [Planctomycetota bacterium]|nr:rRNA maturation RNase YbeY [Planctomycetota bacterium]MDA1213884.1 rRNA maturation RNase YbeY [Planctomycetota bacterium]